tara:strand:+ start:692 stop:3265 length:2574 start_codon:yes stop_codon:yes gene_type:complete
VKVNKISVKQMGGQAASQQVDPAIQQITEFISTSINNGEDPVEVVMSLVDQQVDQETIAQVFMQVGYAQEDIVTLFEQVQQKMQPPGPASAEQQTQDPQEIARNESMAEESQMEQAKSGIEIKPENKGKFTSWAEARGMSVQAAASKVMSNTDEYPPSVVKMANFAKNAAGWNKQEGGDVSNYTEGVRQREGSYNPPNRKYTLDPRFKKEGGEFEPHFMYKGERKIRAKDMATHLRLKEAGYGHDAPKAQTGLEVDKKGNTFIDGVVQAKDEWTAAPSYVNPLAFESGNNFSVTDAAQVLGTGINKLLGSGDKNKDGLRDGFLRDAKGKRALRNQQKGDYYNYEIKLDPNDPNAYGYDNLDLYNTSKGNGGLRDLQTFTDDVKENSRFNYNTETGKYDALISSRELNDDIYGERKGFLGIGKKEGNSTYELGKNINYFDNIDDETRQQIIDFGNASKNGMPKGTTLSIDPETGAVSNPFPGVDNPNEYNTMMGYNKYGKKEAPKSMIPTNVDGQPVAAINNTPPRVPQLSFTEWTMQDSVRRTGANAPQQYQDYLDGVQSNSTIQSNQPSLLDKVGTGLNEAGEFIKGKYNEAKPFIQQGVDQAGKSIMQAGDFVEDKVSTGLDFLKNIKFEEGGDLPKAQGGMFDFDFTPYFDEEQQAGQENYFANLGSGQTNYMEDTQNVADAQLLKKNPGLGTTPQQQETNALFTPQAEVSLNSFLPEKKEEVEFSDPTVKRTNKFQGGFNRFMDSPGMKGYTGGSEFAVQGARVVNNFFDDRAIEDAQADNRNNMVADNLYATKENPMLKRGAWDINTGTFGSEGQRTVRTNMGIAQEGGEMATVDSLLLAKLIAAGADIEIL